MPNCACRPEASVFTLKKLLSIGMLVAVGVVLHLAPGVRAQTPSGKAAPLVGGWTLNKELSDGPQDPSTADRDARGDGRGRRGGGGGGGFGRRGGGGFGRGGDTVARPD